MEISRRDFLKTAASLTALTTAELSNLQDALAATSAIDVVWLQGQGCTGCSVSFLNSIYYAPASDVLIKTLDVKFHSTLMASAGSLAWNNVMNLPSGFILIVEGAIPSYAAGKYCTVANDVTILSAFRTLAPRASYIMAIGTCASFGGISAGKPNPTGAKSVKATMSSLSISKPLINIPGCPVHPDWLVGTISYILTNKAAPARDSYNRPTSYFGTRVHDRCFNRSSFNDTFGEEHNSSGTRSCLSCHSSSDGDVDSPKRLGQSGCLYALNCKGRTTYADCPTRKWNSPAAGQYGVNWCIAAKAPCHGCTQPTFPDGMSPFYTLSGPGVASSGSGTGSTQVQCSDCHSSQGSTGTLPSGHPSVSSDHYVTTTTPPPTTGGTTTQVQCSNCHSSRGSVGTLPSGHPSVSSSNYVTTSGTTSTTSSDNDDREESDDDDREERDDD